MPHGSGVRKIWFRGKGNCCACVRRRRRTQETIGGDYGERLHAVVLFGSEVRGDARPDSDIDVLTVLETLPGDYGDLSSCDRGPRGTRHGIHEAYGGVAEASLASAKKAIEKAKTILAALEPLLPNDAS